MEPTCRGLQATRAMVTQPIQWQLLLLLAEQAQTPGQLLRQIPLHHHGRCWLGLLQLQRHQLVMFHMKQWRWSLTAAGETLRPILSAIQTCSQIQEGGNTDDT
ncbi:hypothetical protein ACUIJQ_11795 [Levilactobacillus hammesii]|nr:hypothetical protein [Levilactobacillus hammesii]